MNEKTSDILPPPPPPKKKNKNNNNKITLRRFQVEGLSFFRQGEMIVLEINWYPFDKKVYKIIQIVCVLWLAIKPFYLSVGWGSHFCKIVIFGWFELRPFRDPAICIPSFLEVIRYYSYSKVLIVCKQHLYIQGSTKLPLRKILSADIQLRCRLNPLTPWSDQHETSPYNIDKLETTPLCVVVSYAYLVFSQPPACLHQAM